MNLVKFFNYIYFKKRNGIEVQRDLDVRGFVYIKNKGSIKIGSGFVCNSGLWRNPIGGDSICRFVTRDKGKILIGDNVGISNSTIVSACEVVIGNNVMIGGGCRIWDTNFHSVDPLERELKKEVSIKSKPVYLLANCFIGGGSIILPGVTVGRNSIVGAGSVVRESIPNDEIWAGNPAIKISTIR